MKKKSELKKKKFFFLAWNTLFFTYLSSCNEENYIIDHTASGLRYAQSPQENMLDCNPATVARSRKIPLAATVTLTRLPGWERASVPGRCSSEGQKDPARRHSHFMRGCRGGSAAECPAAVARESSRSPPQVLHTRLPGWERGRVPGRCSEEIASLDAASTS